MLTVNNDVLYKEAHTKHVPNLLVTNAYMTVFEFCRTYLNFADKAFWGTLHPIRLFHYRNLLVTGPVVSIMVPHIDIPVLWMPLDLLYLGIGVQGRVLSVRPLAPMVEGAIGPFPQLGISSVAAGLIVGAGRDSSPDAPAHSVGE